MNNETTRLVACPLCGANKGYTLDDGSTFRWWSVRCADCGQEVSEARAALAPTPPARTEPCDAAWNAAGAHAEKLRTALTLACETLASFMNLPITPAEAWAQGFSAGDAWRGEVARFWETHDYGQAPDAPANPYAARSEPPNAADEAGQTAMQVFPKRK